MTGSTPRHVPTTMVLLIVALASSASSRSAPSLSASVELETTVPVEWRRIPLVSPTEELPLIVLSRIELPGPAATTSRPESASPPPQPA